MCLSPANLLIFLEYSVYLIIILRWELRASALSLQHYTLKCPFMGGLSKRDSNFISDTALFALKPKLGWL